jgi:phosphoribosyl 1,2-cyclic phosphodiesterase
LLDAGLSFRELTMRMAQVGADFSSLDAVFVTHEHSDHWKGLGPLARKTKATVYSTEGTLRGIQDRVGKLPHWKPLKAGRPQIVGDLLIEPYATPHDARESVAFAVHCGDKKIGHAADLGTINSTVVDHLRGSDALLVESNHDVDMLMAGPYTWPLKQRIKSLVGHLSNEVCGELLAKVVHSKLQAAVLMHLSETNNCVDIAEITARQALGSYPAEMVVARQDRATPFITI